MKKAQYFIENPFKVLGITKRIYTTKEDEIESVNTDTGEMLIIKKLPKSKEVIHDGMVYTKLFHIDYECIMGLGVHSLRLLMYCAYNARANSDSIFISIDDCLQRCNFKRTSYFLAINELCDAKIIARMLGRDYQYWINPNVFFNGNRVRLVQQSHI
jgi:hypothetical protein